ncbi:Fe3+ hydroxamate ABC transporter substrate-binding protein [Bacillus subtilis]|nr:Fe3+ hydroxamate ABC transporter substrate-binding protein [Bacillus subtilis]
MSSLVCKNCKKKINKDEKFYYIDKPRGLSGITHVKKFLENNGLLLCECCIREYLQN